MSLAELKDQIAVMSAEDRLELAALISHLNQADDAAWQAELDRRLDAMDHGNKTGLAELEQVHEKLTARGQ
jgi:putative addiction module component (TIGR02574 family)